MPILVDLERVSARRPDRPLFEALSLVVSTGDRLGVVGINGTGKSTLLRLLAGAAEPESGTVRRGRGVRIGFLDQQPALPPGTVRAAVGSGWEVAEILERLGMGGLAEADVATLSGGQAKRVALARVLVTEVDLLILDEPTNHLDIDAIAWLEARLAAYRGGLVLVTHDRHVLDRVTTRMLELDRGRAIVHEGGYASYLDARAERAEREAGAEVVRRNLARSELAWLRRGAPARTRKPKARIAAATAIVEGGPPSPPGGAGPIDLGPGGPTGWTGGGGAGAKPTPTPRLGDKVITLHGGGHYFGPRDPLSGNDSGLPAPWLFRGLDVDLEPGGRLAVVGPNGSGKTTLLDILAGRLAPTEGRVETAGTVVLSFYDQTGRGLDPDQRVREAVAGKAAQPGWEQVRLMERFRFDSDLQWATIGTLSGGERRRLQLLLALTAFPNVLLLDEPTNDLDLDTLRALEDFLETWPGSLVIVSHDRALLERTAEDAIVLDGHGHAAYAPGGYAQYEEARRRREQAPIPRPTAAKAAPPVSRDAPAGRPPSGEKKQRSPSTLRRLIGLAEAEMEKAATERDGLLADLAAAGTDHVALARLAETLAGAEARLAAAEERWLELSEELGA